MNTKYVHTNLRCWIAGEVWHKLNQHYLKDRYIYFLISIHKYIIVLWKQLLFDYAFFQTCWCLNQILYDVAFPTGTIPTRENKINFTLVFSLLNSSLKWVVFYLFVIQRQKDLFRSLFFPTVCRQKCFFAWVSLISTLPYTHFLLSFPFTYINFVIGTVLW